MTFLAPLALIGVLLLILPIVVHLFKPRKMKQTPFSSLRWLKQTHPRLIAPPSADASASLATIKALTPGLADGSLSATLPLVRSLLPAAKGREVELVFLTDNLRSRWREPDLQSFLKELPNPVRVKVI